MRPVISGETRFLRMVWGVILGLRWLKPLSVSGHWLVFRHRVPLLGGIHRRRRLPNNLPLPTYIDFGLVTPRNCEIFVEIIAIKKGENKNESSRHSKNQCLFI